MDKMSSSLSSYIKAHAPLPLFKVAAILVLFLATTTMDASANQVSPTPTSTPTSSTTTHPSQVSTEAGEHRKSNSVPPVLSMPSQVSPFLFGTGLELTSTTDPFITDDNVGNLMQQMHITIIRMPTRIGANTNPQIPIETEMAAARKIRDLGAVPLVNLRGPADPNVLSDDLLMVNGLNEIFGHRPVFYELGNESDLGGFDKVAYTSKWNVVIPALKQAALNGKFIGPVNFQYNDDYLRYFLQNANPRPDAVSWHEYTCDTSGVFTNPPDSGSTCIAKLDRWNVHFNDAHIAMHDVLGGTTEVPIIISEYNYDPHIPALNNDSQFITEWTSKAIEILAKNHIFAALQHSVLSLTPLISNGQLSIQATVLKSEYEKLLRRGGGFSFEDGTTDGWQAESSQATVQNSTTIARDGIHSLQVNLTDPSAKPAISVSGSAIANLNVFPHLTAQVYGPAAGTATVTARLFVQDCFGRLLYSQPVTLTTASWNLLRFNLPPTPAQARKLGIQFTSTDTTVSTVYVDAISWI
jgi:hypothetical protein